MRKIVRNWCHILWLLTLGVSCNKIWNKSLIVFGIKSSVAFKGRLTFYCLTLNCIYVLWGSHCFFLLIEIALWLPRLMELIRKIKCPITLKTLISSNWNRSLITLMINLKHSTYKKRLVVIEPFHTHSFRETKRFPSTFILGNLSYLSLS